jgi:hypothetical protein
MMLWFSRSCRECGVYFKPVGRDEFSRLYCHAHAQPKREENYRVERAKEWASRHLDQIEKMMLEETIDYGNIQAAMANQALSGMIVGGVAQSGLFGLGSMQPGKL